MTGHESDTRERLMDVAERLFSEQGYEVTSGRQITTEASANIAAIHYHFGGKKDLLGAVLTRRQEPITRARLERLEALEADPNRPPSVEEILAAFLEPALFRARHPENPTARISKLVSRLLIEKPKDLEGIVTTPFISTMSRFLDTLERVLPQVPRSELIIRLQMVLGVLIHFATGLQEAPLFPKHPSPADDDAAVLRPVIAFLAAGFNAPPTVHAVSIESGEKVATGTDEA